MDFAIHRAKVANGAEEWLLSQLADRLRLRLDRLLCRPTLNLVIELSRARLSGDDRNPIGGLFGSLLGPIAMLAVTYAIFSSRFGAEIPTYPLYLLLGIILVRFFTSVTRDLMGLFSSQRTLLLNTIVPIEALIVSQVLTRIHKLLLQLLLCTALSVWYGLFSVQTVLLALPLLVAYLALALGTGLTLSILRAFIQDAKRLWGLVSRTLFFSTPVFYSLDAPTPWLSSLVYWLNPVTPFVVSFRTAFMGYGEVAWGPLAHSLLLGLFALVIGYVGLLLFEQAAVESA